MLLIIIIYRQLTTKANWEGHTQKKQINKEAYYIMIAFPSVSDGRDSFMCLGASTLGAYMVTSVTSSCL